MRPLRPNATVRAPGFLAVLLLSCTGGEPGLVPRERQLPDAAVIDAPVIDAPVIDAAVIDAAVIDAPVIDAAPVDAAVDLPPFAIAITSPLEGGQVAPGQRVSVTVGTGGDVLPAEVSIFGTGDSADLYAPPFTAELRVPVEAIGTTSFIASAVYPDGRMALSQRVRLNVHIAEPLISLSVLNGSQFLQRPGRTRQVLVIGTYADGVLRDLTPAAVGTRYSVSQLASIITVTPDGLITAVGPGVATLIVRNATVITSVSVHVGQPACGDEVLDPGEECDDGNISPGDGCDGSCHLEPAGAR